MRLDYWVAIGQPLITIVISKMPPLINVAPSICRSFEKVSKLFSSKSGEGFGRLEMVSLGNIYIHIVLDGGLLLRVLYSPAVNTEPINLETPQLRPPSVRAR